MVQLALGELKPNFFLTKNPLLSLIPFTNTAMPFELVVWSYIRHHPKVCEVVSEIDLLAFSLKHPKNWF